MYYDVVSWRERSAAATWRIHAERHYELLGLDSVMCTVCSRQADGALTTLVPKLYRHMFA
eukprot:8665936-Pyramimonas_sp.AAC.1